MVELCCKHIAWWRHQMETFSALLALCAGNSQVTCEFSAKRPVTQNFDICFDLRLNKRLSKQSWGWWFETPPRSLWRHRNGQSASYGSGLWRLSGIYRIGDHTLKGMLNYSKRVTMKNYATINVGWLAICLNGYVSVATLGCKILLGARGACQ